MQLVINSRIDNDECLPKSNENKQARFPKAEKITIIKSWHATRFSYFFFGRRRRASKHDDITPNSTHSVQFSQVNIVYSLFLSRKSRRGVCFAGLASG